MKTETADISNVPLAVRQYFAEIGRKGGRKSKRILSRAEALQMVEAKKQKQRNKNK